MSKKDFNGLGEVMQKHKYKMLWNTTHLGASTQYGFTEHIREYLSYMNSSPSLKKISELLGFFARNLMAVSKS